MTHIEAKLKRKMDIIVEYAYRDKDDTKRKKFRDYTIYLDSKSPQSFLGKYTRKDRKVHLYHSYFFHDETDASETLLHEVAHHIDCEMHGTTGHQKEFYEIYKTLMYASLDLNMVDLDCMKNLDNHMSGYKKVMKIVNAYVPDKSPYIMDVGQTGMFFINVEKTNEKIIDYLKQHEFFYYDFREKWMKNNLTHYQAAMEKQELLFQLPELEAKNISIVPMKETKRLIDYDEYV